MLLKHEKDIKVKYNNKNYYFTNLERAVEFIINFCLKEEENE